MSTPTRTRRHRDSPRTRRLAREAGVDLGSVRPTGPHGRATADDLARAARPATTPPAALQAAPPTAPALAGKADGHLLPEGQVTGGAPGCSLLELDVTALLRRAGAVDGAPARAHLLAAAVGALARAVSALRPTGLPDGPVALRVRADDGRTVTLEGADLLSADGVVSRLAAAAPETSTPSTAVLDVTATSGTTVDVPRVRPGALLALSVGPVARRPVVVPGEDGQEQIGIRSVVWLAVATEGGPAPVDAPALLARVGSDLRARPAVAR